jgi:hypothetical protein
MGLLYPYGLLLGALIPLLALAYLVRERPNRVVVSSLLAFRALGAGQGRRKWGRPRLDWMFFAELIILLAAALAAAEPYLARKRKPIAVILDNSAVMQTKMPSGQSRFEAARARLFGFLSGSEDEITVYLTTPTPHRLGPPLVGESQARAALGALRPLDAAEDLHAVSELITRLGASARYAQIVVASSHPLRSLAAGPVVGLTIGDSVANFALGSFIVERGTLGSQSVKARATVANFSAQAAALRLTLSDAVKPLAVRTLDLAPGAIGAVDFADLPPAPFFRLQLEPSDAFALDNIAYAVASASREMRILFVSPTASDAAGLDALPGVRVRIEAPENYTPRDSFSADVAIFEYTAPKELPGANSLLVLPPGSTAPFDFLTEPAADVRFMSWRRPNPLTDGVNFRLFELPRAEFFGPHPWMDTVADGEGGGLILTGERDGRRYVALGFVPFPYLGKNNLPMSVFTLNVLSYLGRLLSPAQGYRAGQSWRIPPDVEQVITPSGASIAVTPASAFEGAVEQGIYQLVGAQGRILRAVNFNNLSESNLLNPAPLEVTLAPKTGAPAQIETKAPLATTLITLALALAALEAAVAYRRRRATGGASS